MIEFRILRASAADWRRIRAIRLRSLGDAPNAFGTTLAEDEARPEALIGYPGLRTIEIARFLAVAPDENVPGNRRGRPVYRLHRRCRSVRHVGGARGTRSASRPCLGSEAVIAWARGEGYRRVVLDVADANRAAIRLYESCGFVATGETGTLPPPREHITEHRRCLRLV